MNNARHAEPRDVDSMDLEKQHQRVRKNLERLSWSLSDLKKRRKTNCDAQSKIKAYLELAPEVSDALKTLSSKLFEQDLRILEEKMTIALQEVLRQPIKFRANTGFKGNVATVDFSIERSGNREDLKRGQGGSVHNILSVGLRMFALTMISSGRHGKFLMLDEPDCWLQPELVPRLVKIVYEAGKELGYQVILISHHELRRFEEFADKIYSFEPSNQGVKVVCSSSTADSPDDP